MPIEIASVRATHKSWGVSDLQPWSDIDGTRDAVGQPSRCDRGQSILFLGVFCCP
jgi:hypothetical protein